MEEKLTLLDILSKMKDFDDDVSDLSEEDFKEMVGELLPEKVDGCKKFLINVETRINTLKREINDLTSAKKSLENTMSNFKSYLTYALRTTGTTKVTGSNHYLSLSQQTTIKPKELEITAHHFMSFNMLKDGLIKKSYSLDNAMFKDVCKENEEFKSQYADEIKSDYVTFRVKKGV